MPTTEEVMKMLEHESYTNLAALTGADAEQLRREAADRIMTQLAGQTKCYDCQNRLGYAFR